MRTRLIITDTNIFIDLHDIDLLNEFFQLDVEIHTTSTVIHELFPEQQKVLNTYGNTGKLQIHIISGPEVIEIQSYPYPKSLSFIDKSVIYVGEKINAYILTGDKSMRNYAKKENLECHGILWLFDQLVDAEILSGSFAAVKLKLLVSLNNFYGTNEVLMKAIQRRIDEWEGLS